jgi:hypothetical protein
VTGLRLADNDVGARATRMIGKSLNERFVLGHLPEERAVALLREAFASQAPHLVQVRAQDARMIACLFVRADKLTVRVCKDLGFDLKLGSTGVFGLLGEDAVRLFPDLPAHERAWLATACGPRETKVLLISGGRALLSIETSDGKVKITAVPSLAS